MGVAMDAAVTDLLERWGEDAGARDQAVATLYRELRGLASREFARSDSHTLQTTALLNEAMLKLIGPATGGFENRGHFFAAAAKAMRQVLVDRARHHSADKRGGGQRALPLEHALEVALPPADELLALDAALRKLEALDPAAVQIVELRYFAGLTLDETAAAVRLHPSTVSAEWMHARAWLRRELDPA